MIRVNLYEKLASELLKGDRIFFESRVLDIIDIDAHDSWGEHKIIRFTTCDKAFSLRDTDNVLVVE